jgi:hypothetical protein
VGGGLLRAVVTELGFRIIGGGRPPLAIEEIVGAMVGMAVGVPP